jgi:drug/metabolite transporter (DMT)-like permease
MWIIALSFLILFEGIADIFAKEYSLQGTATYWLLAIAGYVIANSFWLYSIRHGSGLARGAVLFSIGSAILAVLLGLFAFHEKVNKVELVGILFGIVAVTLIFWPDLVSLFK